MHVHGAKLLRNTCNLHARAFASGASESKRQIAQSMFGLSLIPRITEYLKDFKLCAVLKQLDVGQLENFQMTTCTGCVWTEVDAGELGIAALCWLCAPAGGRRVAGCE